ncbi:MAG: hypothetical protein LW863_04480, partial [Flammeovirgaceae bacterium]|nr:hypothetical protein [Flammeovirgaceae bacterium]
WAKAGKAVEAVIAAPASRTDRRSNNCCMLVSQTLRGLTLRRIGMGDPYMTVKLQFVHLDADNDIPAVWDIALPCLNPLCVNYPF